MGSARATNILGISAYYHDSAAALLKDGDLAAAAQQERFSRKKHDLTDLSKKNVIFLDIFLPLFAANMPLCITVACPKRAQISQIDGTQSTPKARALVLFFRIWHCPYL